MEEYICKNSINEKPLTVSLSESHLMWQQGDKCGQVSYYNIISIRLTQVANKFTINIELDSHRSIVLTNRFYLTRLNFEDRSRQYNTFVRVLHYYLKNMRTITFSVGSAWREWILASKKYQPDSIPLPYLPN
jgi:hypothetical protein